MEISLNIPDELLPRLQLHKNQLAQILSLGLRELEARFMPANSFSGLTDVMEFLAGLPTAEEILRLRPSKQLQNQLELLMEKQHSEGLSEEEEIAWQQYQYVEHLVRKAKLNAAKKRQH